MIKLILVLAVVCPMGEKTLDESEYVSRIILQEHTIECTTIMGDYKEMTRTILIERRDVFLNKTTERIELDDGKKFPLTPRKGAYYQMSWVYETKHVYRKKNKGSYKKLLFSWRPYKRFHTRSVVYRRTKQKINFLSQR